MMCDFESKDGEQVCKSCGFRIKVEGKVHRKCTNTTQKEVEMPGLIRKAVNFTKAVTEHIKDGMTEVSKEEQERRMGICQGCDKFRDGACSLCGCHMNLKTRWRSSNCPDKPPKW